MIGWNHLRAQAWWNISEDDKIDLRQCVKLTREILNQKAFDEFRGEELRPGPEVQIGYIVGWFFFFDATSQCKFIATWFIFAAAVARKPYKVD